MPVTNNYEEIHDIVQSHSCRIHPKAKLRAIWLEDDNWVVWCEGHPMPEGHYPERIELIKSKEVEGE